MIYKTKIGDVEIPDDQIYIFEEGIPGFENLKKFSLIFPQETFPIGWLLSLEDPRVGLPVVDPKLVRPDYDPIVSVEDLEKMGVSDRTSLLYFCVLTIPPGKPEETTINLRAPIVINQKAKKGMQVILGNEDYELRHNLSEEMKRAKSVV
ncbi:flagellar assembly protein FliW [Thermotoga sp. KOL6]|uniref:flagellar assembly protein FliW n=1 Tax=Thermotoga sp. KOL6 TaxID=126741 RepID=UPI000C756583|nr:flagellar assembly protein FliW [Thermotoga sp. KOL6]PLV58680.1 flagellar assembly protein FliW [Thermotoga sp. KOL6]